MAITTYDELKTAIANWLEDTHAQYTNRIPEFITLAEADIFRKLRIRQMRTSTTGTLTAGTATLSLPTPTRFAGLASFQLQVGGVYYRITGGSEEALVAQYSYGATGIPQGYIIEGSSMRFYPTPDSNYSYRMGYYQKPQALSDSVSTNDVLDSHPDLYLAGSLIHAFTFTEDDVMVQKWNGIYQNALMTVQEESVSDSFLPSGMMLTDRGTP